MHESDHLDRRHEIVLLDAKNPRSISNLMPEAFAIAMRALWNSELAPALLGVNENGLLKELRRRQKDPSPLDHKVRAKFWIEFERIQSLRQVQPMQMANILGNDFPKDVFYKYFITDPCRLAFLLCPPQDYVLLIDMVLNQNLLKLSEYITSLEAQDQAGAMKAIEKLLQIEKELSNRKFALDGRRKRRGGDVEDETPVPVQETPKAETSAEKLARIKAQKGQAEILPGQAL